MCVFRKISILLLFFSFSITAQELQKIPRRLPPEGIKVPDDQRSKIEKSCKTLMQKLSQIDHPQKADIEIYAKAVSYALINGEFYKKQDFAKALKLLEEAHKKAELLSQGKTPWAKSKGIQLRGFYSAVDDSPQPYGIEIPDKLDLNKPQALYIWLHGRDDKVTDLHFMAQFSKSKFQFPGENVITVHPFGRQCIGYKSAGETDVLEVIEHVKANYKIDENRIALMGFSMGGAGAWHLGAHYAEKWALVHPGAGFAETAQYNKMTEDKYPAWYTQKLWGLYDVPNYTRNLFNQPLIAYSGEVDKQIQAARVMEEAFKEHGKTFPHIIGPKMGHKYDDKSMSEILAFVKKAVAAGRDPYSKQVYLQTRTLRYSSMHWVQAHGLEEHWLDSRIDAQVNNNEITLQTKNISRLKLTSPWPDKDIPAGTILKINGEKISVKDSAKSIFLINEGQWQTGKENMPGLHKKPGLQGPVDDAFLAPFMLVTPGGKIVNTKFKSWMDFEIEHLKNRWRELFRGDIRIKKDSEVSPEDIKKYNLILWGTPESNSILGKIVQALPVKWKEENIEVNGKTYSRDFHVPQFIYPNPQNSSKYIVVNSGPTFRENHDRTNSLQNPKQPDWSIIDIRQAPNGESPGKIVDANFFDEKWDWKK